MSNASRLRDEIEDAIEDWMDEADEALERDTVTKHQQTEQADEIRRRHGQEIDDYLDRIARETADVNDDMPQEEKEEILAEVKQRLHDLR